jgi:hypothetical protein
VLQFTSRRAARHRFRRICGEIPVRRSSGNVFPQLIGLSVRTGGPPSGGGIAPGRGRASLTSTRCPSARNPIAARRLQPDDWRRDARTGGSAPTRPRPRAAGGRRVAGMVRPGPPDRPVRHRRVEDGAKESVRLGHRHRPIPWSRSSRRHCLNLGGLIDDRVICPSLGPMWSFTRPLYGTTVLGRRRGRSRIHDVT